MHLFHLIKIQLVLFCVLIFGSVSQAQQPEIPKYRLFPTLGINYQKALLIDVNMMYGQQSMHSGFGLRGWRLGAEFNLDSKQFIVGPKVSYELTVLFLTLRPNAVAYFYNGETDLRLMPEIGLSFFSLVNLTYGYAQPLTNTQFQSIGRHRLGLNVNLSRNLWKNVLGW